VPRCRLILETRLLLEDLRQLPDIIYLVTYLYYRGDKGNDWADEEEKAHRCVTEDEEKLRACLHEETRKEKEITSQ